MEDTPFCYTTEEMSTLVDGTAPHEMRVAFERHLFTCPECRREWIELKIATGLKAEQPPLRIQEIIKAAPAIRKVAKRRKALKYSPVKTRSYAFTRIAAFAAAILLVSFILYFLSADKQDTEPQRPNPELTSVVNNDKKFVDENTVEEQLTEAQNTNETIRSVENQKKIDSAPLKGPAQTPVELAEIPEPKPFRNTQEDFLPDEIEPVEKLAEKIAPEPEPVEKEIDKIAKLPEKDFSKLEEVKKAPPRDESAVPEEKLATNLSKEDAELFKKHYMNSLICTIDKERQIAREAEQRAKQFDPILGRLPGRQPSAQPKQSGEKEQKPESEPKSDPTPESPAPDAPPPLPRIDKLRKEGKLPPEKSEPEPEPANPPASEPKPKPDGSGEANPKNPDTPPPVAPPQPKGPVKKGLAELPEVTDEELKEVAAKAGFEPMKIPGLKEGIKLASAEVIEDSRGGMVIHLFYYFEGNGFSVFERKTAREDGKSDYQVHYHGKAKYRSLMWATENHEYVVFSHKLSKKDLSSIEKSVRQFAE